MKRILVFGANGFLGSHLVNHLRELRDSTVIPVTRSTVDLNILSTIREVVRAGDILVNTAGYANATDNTAQGRLRFEQSNVVAVKNLAQVAIEADVHQLVHLSSVAAMGRLSGAVVSEEMKNSVASPYAQSKLEAEKLLEDFKDQLPITIMRPTSVFGEGRNLAYLLCKLVSGGFLVLPNGGRAKIPFTYVGNVAKAVELALGNPKCYSRTFIVGDTESYSLKEIVDVLADKLAVKPVVLSLPSGVFSAGVSLIEWMARLRKVPPLLDRTRLSILTESTFYSVEAFREATEYIPPFSLEQAAERIVTWYRSQSK